MTEFVVGLFACLFVWLNRAYTVLRSCAISRDAMPTIFAVTDASPSWMTIPLLGVRHGRLRGSPPGVPLLFPCRVLASIVVVPRR